MRNSEEQPSEKDTLGQIFEWILDLVFDDLGEWLLDLLVLLVRGIGHLFVFAVRFCIELIP